MVPALRSFSIADGWRLPTIRTMALSTFAIILGVYVAWCILQAYLDDRFCPVNDMKDCAKPLPNGARKRRGRAVIVGASITGILAARICADHFEEVLLLDAEECTTDPAIKRTRVKQHSQLHLFLGLLYPSLCQLFPAFDSELRAEGGKVVPPHPVAFRGAGFLKLPDAKRDNWPVRQVYISREALEAMLRRLLLKNHSNVKASTALVTRILLDKNDSKRVAGLSVRYPEGRAEDVDASFVVDASGVACGGIGWLKAAGFPAPDKKVYDPAIVYTCFTFNTAPATRAKYDALQGPYPWVETGHIGACFNPDQHSVFMAIEGERIRTMYQTFTNEGGEPETVADFERVTAIQPYREWQKEAIKLLCRAEDEDGADPAVRSKVVIGQCFRVQYHADQMPHNFVPMGDAVLRLNPIFGQGCTKSMIDVLTLSRALRKFAGRVLDQDFLSYFLELHYARTDPFWESTRAHDYAYPATKTVDGEDKTWGSRKRKFTRWIMQAGCMDATLGGIVTEVAAQLRPACTYMYPWFLARCLAAHTSSRLGLGSGQ